MHIPLNWAKWLTAAAVVFLILGGNAQVSVGQSSPPISSPTAMTFHRARRVVDSAVGWDRVRFEVRNDELCVRGNLDHRIETDRRHPNRHVQFSIDRDAVIPFSHIARVQLRGFYDEHGAETTQGAEIYLSGSTQVGPDYTIGFPPIENSHSSAEEFVSALQWLISHPSELAPDPAATQRFEVQAAAWRALAVKPELPEEARIHKVLAQDAVQRKDFDKAADEYEAALENFPTWPEGQFNLALICEETSDYACAVEHMENYLGLVPDASDAQAAKDKLIIWKDRLGHAAN